MKRNEKIEVIELAYRAGLSQEATPRTLSDLVQVLHQSGIKATVIARFCGLSDRQVMTLIAKEL